MITMHDPAKPYRIRFTESGSAAVMATPDPVRCFATSQARAEHLVMLARMSEFCGHSWVEGRDYTLETAATEKVA